MLDLLSFGGLGIYFLLISVVVGAIGLVGLASQNLGLANKASPIAVGLLIVLLVEYPTIKFFGPEAILPALLGLALGTTFAISVSVKQKEFQLSKLKLLLRDTLALTSLFTIAISIQVATLSGRVPLLTSFDTTSGDMSWYLEQAQNLSIAGWDSPPRSYELGPNDDILGNLGLAPEHMGSGYVLISVVSAALSLAGWQVGIIVLGLLHVAVVSSAYDLVSRNAKKPQPLLFALTIMLFSTSSYLVVIGWWAVNQLTFTTLFLTGISLILNVKDEKSSTYIYFLFGGAIALCLEVYPSIAAYAGLPIFLLVLVLALIGEKRDGGRFGTLKPLVMLVPFGYSLLGTIQFLPHYFIDQITHSLKMSFIAPSLLDFIGLEPLLSLVDLRGNAGFGNLSYWVFISVLALVAYRNRRKFKLENDLLLLAVVLGSGLLILYSTLIDPESYQAHKLRLLWVPILIVVVLSMINWQKKFLGSSWSKKRLASTSFLGLLIVTNALVFSSSASKMLGDETARQMLAITNEKIEISDELRKLAVPAVGTDFSHGNGWLPQDRVIIPAVIGSGETFIYSGSRLAGFPFMSGWVISGPPTEKPGGDTSEIFYSNRFYSIKHVCRLLCADESSGLIAYLGGVENTENSFSQFANTSYALSGPTGRLSVKIHGAPNTEVTAQVSYISAKCEDATLNTVLGHDGLGRIHLSKLTTCSDKLKKIHLSAK